MGRMGCNTFALSSYQSSLFRRSLKRLNYSWKSVASFLSLKSCPYILIFVSPRTNTYDSMSTSRSTTTPTDFSTSCMRLSPHSLLGKQLLHLVYCWVCGTQSSYDQRWRYYHIAGGRSLGLAHILRGNIFGTIAKLFLCPFIVSLLRMEKGYFGLHQ